MLDNLSREEIYLLARKKAGGGGGDITVESLSVTENGTYTAPSGKAYSPVSVNVDLPENAYYLKSASGNPINITDGEELKCQSAKVTFMPKQSGSGDPSPENVRPISGWDGLVLTKTGVNQWDEEWELGYYNINTGESAISYLQIRCKNKIKVVPNTNYYIKSPITMWILEYDSDDNYLSISTSELNQVFTTSANTQYIRFYVIKSYGTTYNNDISINYPSTDTEYHAYTGETHTATFDSTVYGGSYDFVSGSGKSEWGYAVFDGSEDEDWNMSTSGLFTIDSITDYKKTLENIGKSNLLPFDTNVQSKSRVQNNTIAFYGGTQSIERLYVRMDSIDSLADFKDFLSNNNLQVAYKLATPTEITLTPEVIELLKGSNIVSTDGDNADLEYWSKSNTPNTRLTMKSIPVDNTTEEIEEEPVEETQDEKFLKVDTE